MDPFPPSVSRTGGDMPPADFLPLGMSLIPTLQVRACSQGRTTGPWHRSSSAP